MTTVVVVIIVVNTEGGNEWSAIPNTVATLHIFCSNFLMLLLLLVLLL